MHLHTVELLKVSVLVIHACAKKHSFDKKGPQLQQIHEFGVLSTNYWRFGPDDDRILTVVYLGFFDHR
jgi:hypothetical protein